jgi:hypothetical protein
MLIVKRQRAVGIELQRFALGAEREAIQRVGLEEMFLVVERQGPKAVDRWQLAFGENNGVTVATVQTLTGRIEVGVDVAGLLRRVVIHIGLGRRIDGSPTMGPASLAWAFPLPKRSPLFLLSCSNQDRARATGRQPMVICLSGDR